LLPNKVVISGTLHKQIFFVADDDIVRHQGEDIPFSTFVDLPGINPGDQVTITPVVEHVGYELTEPIVTDDESGDDVSGSGDTESGVRSGLSTSTFDLSDPYVEVPVSPIFRRLIQRTVICLILVGSVETPIRIATVAAESHV
jgi:hypothetical protein